jgi:general secretion pathway protein A
MYERYFQLRERPFALSPDPEYLYLSKVHQEALSYLRYGIEGHAGFVVITGEIGSGKTTMLQSLLNRLDRNTAVARIVNTMLDARELLEAILIDFGIDPTGMSKAIALHKLAEFLVQQRHAGRITLLAIDEAQNLSLPALEEIRMLSNLETEKSKLIQIILIGQPDLRDKLALPQLEQLRQRITVSYHLLPLDAEETANYVNHRLRRAAIGPPVEFPRDVTTLIHSRSRGVPRIINVIADATLLFAYGVDRRNIDVSIAREALAELDATGVLASYANEGSPQVIGANAPSVSDAEAIRLASDDIRRREEEIRKREQQVAQRELALAEQQRVVEEEARLLAAARAASRVAAGAPGATSSGSTSPGTGAGSGAGASPSSGGASRGAGAVKNASGIGAESNAPGRVPLSSAARPVSVSAGIGAARVASASSVPRTSAPVMTGRVAAAAPVSPAYRAPMTPGAGVRVQRYQSLATARTRRSRYGMWERLRRVLFGVTEPEI